MADTNTPLNIRFLKGTQANLDAIKNDNTKSFTPGAFYLTEDSERLYYAKDENNVAYLNKYITTVDYVSTSSAGYQQGSSTLPSTANIGDFYYIKSGNILCFYNGGTGENDGDTISKWTQVNVDTQDTDTKVSGFSIFRTGRDIDSINYNYILSQADKDGNAVGNPISSSFEISKADINALVTQQTVDVTVAGNKTDTTGTKATIETKLSSSNSDSFSIEAGQNINIEVTDSTSSAIGNIKINATDTKYDLSSPANTTTIVLKEEDGSVQDTITFAQATNTASSATNQDIIVSGATENKIEVAHKLYDTKTDSEVVDRTGSNNTTNSKVGRTGSFKVLKDVTVSNGHVTGVTTADIILDIPEDTNTYVTAVEADAEGKITITQENGETVTSGKDLFYTIGNKTIYNKGSLDEGIKDYIDVNLHKITNVMRFRGEVSSATDLPTSPAIGDTYIVTADFTFTVNDKTKSAKTGDILIANGTETEVSNMPSGVIAASTLEWIVVDGEEEDTTYNFSVANNVISLEASTDNGENVPKERKITLIGDGHTTNTSSPDKVISVLGATNGSGAQTITVTHGNYNAQTINGTSDTSVDYTSGEKTFKAITGFTSDAKGHVTGVTSTTYTLPALPDQTNDHKYAIDGTAKKITLQNASGNAKGSTTYAVGKGIGVPTDEAAKLEVTVSGTDPNGTVTYSHAKTTRQDTNNTTAINLPDGQEFTVVTGVTSDTTGHITKITTQKYTAQDTKYTLSGAVVSGTGNSVTITDTLTGTDGAAGGSSAFTITSSNPTNLTISGIGNEVSLGLVWGTF